LGRWLAVVAVLVGAGLTAAVVQTRQTEAQEPVDLSGDWHVQVMGTIALECDVTFQQSATVLTQIMDCGALAGTMSGTINLETRSFSLEGTMALLPVQVSGTLSSDGDVITGIWQGETSFAGDFTGRRVPRDMSSEELGGEWEVEFIDSALVCVLEITSTSDLLRAAASCPDSVNSTLTGVRNAAGMVLSGVIAGESGELIGNLSADALAFNGAWTASGSGGTTVLGVRRGEGAGHIDLTGQWTSSLRGGFPLTCNTAIQQSEAALRSLADCGIISSVSLAGHVDFGYGTYALSSDSGTVYTVRGRVTADGALTGAWFTEFGDFGLSGTLMSTRISDTPQLVDLVGDWTVYVDGRLAGVCSASVRGEGDPFADFAELTARFDCGPGLVGRLEGSVAQPSGRFGLSGMLGIMQFSFGGEPTEDGRLEGEWYAMPPEPEGGKPMGFDIASDERWANFGCFTLQRPGSGTPTACDVPWHHPNVSVDCFSSCGPTPAAPPARPLTTVASEYSEPGPLKPWAGATLIGGFALAGVAWIRLRRS
jgi:hypothetical protein